MENIRGLSIVPIEGGRSIIKNAVKIDPQLETIQQLTTGNIMALARAGSAYEENESGPTADEAGDNVYAVQVGDQPVQFLEYDNLSALVRMLQGEDDDE